MSRYLRNDAVQPIRQLDSGILDDLQQLLKGVWLSEGVVRAKRVKRVKKQGQSTILQIVLPSRSLGALWIRLQSLLPPPAPAIKVRLRSKARSTLR